MALTDIAVRNAKAADKPRKVTDGRGMHLLVQPNGGKYWRLKYRFGGKEKLLALGVYPDVSLAAARKARDQARELLAQGVDPGELRKEEWRAARAATQDSFEAVAREWYHKHAPGWSESHQTRTIGRLEQDAIPWLGKLPIAEISAPELLSVLRRIEERGALYTAHRVRQICGKVFRYAIATGRARYNPAQDLHGALPPIRTRHHASITDPKQVAGLLRALDGYTGEFVTRCALRLAPLVFVRPTELRRAEWSEFDLEGGEWRIPAGKMKMREPHLVPLSTQALAILRELQPLTGAGRYVFPSVRTSERPISENTINAALRRLGYTKDEMTGHGFRSMASTLLNEQGWNRDAIERQLAHAERDESRKSYNYAEYLPERRKMMQHWADYLEGLAKGRAQG